MNEAGSTSQASAAIILSQAGISHLSVEGTINIFAVGIPPQLHILDVMTQQILHQKMIANVEIP